MFPVGTRAKNSADFSRFRSCEETRTSFKLSPKNPRLLDMMCISHCRQGDELIRGVVTGYEIVQQQGFQNFNGVTDAAT